MYQINHPELTLETTFHTCLRGVTNPDLASKFEEISSDLLELEQPYKEKALENMLHTLAPNLCADHELVFGNVTKQDLKKLYNDYFVARKKEARRIYEKILSLAPFGLCPMCYLNQASTLDHYLPKSKFPELSVLPSNLVPTCKDCNTGKSASVANCPEEQVIHPYFDFSLNHNFKDQWVFARVIEEIPVTVEYFIQTPESWSEINRKRALKHFNDFELGRRYGVQASSELASIKDILKINGDPTQNKDCLYDHYSVHSRLAKNSWKTALLQALYNNEWFYTVGYKY